ncbi:hypothetical protein HK096_001679, partial [Nowakowskiella sp. JEL0078]
MVQFEDILILIAYEIEKLLLAILRALTTEINQHIPKHIKLFLTQLDTIIENERSIHSAKLPLMDPAIVFLIVAAYLCMVFFGQFLMRRITAFHVKSL